MTSSLAAEHVVILAHHSLLLAIPAFAPAIAVAGVVTYIAMRDRRKPHGTSANKSDEDGPT
jgi:hypothetical protein